MTIENDLSYDPKTGVFTWTNCARKPFLIGSQAGTRHRSGYRYIKYRQKVYPEHQLAWTISGRVLESGKVIDHINGVRDDNRLCNLQNVTQSVNCSKAARPNRHGVKGVSLHKQSRLFRARHKGRTTYHKTLDDAIEGYSRLISRELDDE